MTLVLDVKPTRQFSARKLIALRERRGWSQMRLADELGVALNTVKNWERGKEPSVGHFLLLSDLLGVPEKSLTDTIV